MTQRLEIAIAALFLGVGFAGTPLEPWRVVAALALCALVAIAGGRFIAALALAAVVAVGWLQHGELRLGVIVAAALLGLLARYVQSRPRAATALGAAGIAVGIASLFLYRAA